jgi:hypothetical protein
VKNQLSELGIESLICGHGDYLKYKKDGMVAIFGHPNVPDGEKVPLRLSFGAEKDPQSSKDFMKKMNENEELAKNYILYDNDTLPGNSGSPVLGRGDKSLGQPYSVKGIHVKKFNAKSTNGAQNIEKIEEWIELGLNFNRQTS